MITIRCYLILPSAFPDVHKHIMRHLQKIIYGKTEAVTSVIHSWTFHQCKDYSCITIPSNSPKVNTHTNREEWI
jgi:hypothetical protein